MPELFDQEQARRPMRMIRLTDRNLLLLFFGWNLGFGVGLAVGLVL